MSNKFKDSGYLRNGCGLIAEERVRQEQQLGWTPEHDDKHQFGELAMAARCYAGHAVGHVRGMERGIRVPTTWPWGAPSWKPADKHPVQDLIKAGALIAAEIDRHHRAFHKACNEITMRELGFEVFDERDDYDLERLDWAGVDPEEFIREHFAEDFERAEYEADLARQSEEAASEEEVDPEDEEDGKGEESVSSE